jgi:hypothetical protein
MHDELDELMSEGFLDSLSDENVGVLQEPVDKPAWVQGDNHTTYRAWQSILALKAEKETSIFTFSKAATSKIPKRIYQIKKSEIAKYVGISAQSMFAASSFSSDLSKFFDEINVSLLELHTKEQKKQKKRSTKGVRSKKKEEVVSEYQQLRDLVRELESRNVKEVLDLLISQLPLDLAQRLKR